MSFSTRAARGACLVLLTSAGLVLTGLAGPATAAPPPTPDLKITTAVPKVLKTNGATDPSGTKPQRKNTLGPQDRRVLTQAQSAGSTFVTALVATDRGSVAKVAKAMAGLGGTVGYRNDKLGYVRINLPVKAAEKAARLDGVFAFDLNTAVPLIDPAVDVARGAKADAAVVAPGSDTPVDNPYMPTNEIGSTDFVKAHPEWDGRGVTIGVLDSGVDLDHPALQTTSTGGRKIVDWVTATDPLVEGDLTWRPMRTSVTGPRFNALGQAWTTPAGTFTINAFSEAVTAGDEPNGDVNRDGDTTDSWGVLYRESDHAIWVDTDDDNDFTDEELRRPYGEDFQVGHLGDDNPATPVRESMPFVVEYRDNVDLAPAGLAGQTADFVNIGIVDGEHGTHVAGITAAHSLFGGQMDGQAPGAKVVSSRACVFNGGCTNVALTEGMINLVVDHHVDVINMSIGGLPAINDGNNVRATIYDRLITDYGVQMFISAGNSGSGLNTIGDPSLANNVVSVAASLSKETALVNYGAVVSAAHALFPFSSRGPREDGGLKPDISAPGSAISTIPTWMPGGPVPEAGYALPPGYAMLNGTSMASPQAAGGAALLLSAGRASDIPITSAQLRTAIYSSAKFDTSVAAAGQGFGEFRVPNAWKLLKRDAALKPGRIGVTAPVCTPLDDYLSTPGSGTGLYNRCAAGEGGQKAGSTKTYTVTLTRRAGKSGSRTHTLRWLGNDGTFSARAKVKLPLDKPVKIKVEAKPKAGAHSAILRVNDTSTPGLDGSLSVVVVAAIDLRAPSYAATVSGRVGRFASKSHVITVPEGAKTLRVALSGIAAGSQTRFLAFDPYGVPVDDTSSLTCYTNRPAPSGCNPQVRSYLDPQPGVWEIAVESRRTTPFSKNPFTVDMEVQGIDISPAVTRLSSVSLGEATPLSWSVTNRFAPITVQADDQPLGSARTERPSIATNEADLFTVTVPAGASRMDVTIGSTSDPLADLDLAVYRDGALVASDADADSEESVSIDNPTAGVYTVEVFGYDVPAGTTAYDYDDAFFDDALGTLSVTSPPLELASGGTGTITGSLTAQQAPGDRQLFGRLLVTGPDGVTVLGSADVIVESGATAQNRNTSGTR